MELGGVKIIASPFVLPVPRFKLSEKVTVTDEFRAEFDAWALEFFGVKETFLVVGGATYVSHGTFEKLARAAQ